jgi:hypothetical protein
VPEVVEAVAAEPEAVEAVAAAPADAAEPVDAAVADETA